MYLHFCFDLDGTLTESHIEIADDVTACNIKGYGRIGPLINRVAEEQKLSITTYKCAETEPELINEVLLVAQVGVHAQASAAIIGYKPVGHEHVGKNMHLIHACVEHKIEPHHYIHILVDDNLTNCELFRKTGGLAILVNEDLSHLDAIEQILDLPHFAREIAEAHYEAAVKVRKEQEAAKEERNQMLR